MNKSLLLAAGTALIVGSSVFPSCSREASDNYPETDDGIAEEIVDLVDGNMVGTYTLGTKAGSILAGEIPDYYTSRNHTDLVKLTRKDSICEIGGIGYFSANLAVADWDNEAYAYNYYWNSHSLLGAVLLSIETQTEWGASDFDILVRGFKDKGFSIAKNGRSSDGLAALLTKGSEFIYIHSGEKENDCYLWVGDKSVEGMGNLYDSLYTSISGSKE